MLIMVQSSLDHQMKVQDQPRDLNAPQHLWGFRTLEPWLGHRPHEAQPMAHKGPTHVVVVRLARCLLHSLGTAVTFAVPCHYSVVSRRPGMGVALSIAGPIVKDMIRRAIRSSERRELISHTLVIAMHTCTGTRKPPLLFC